jgi:multidrug efflux pump subunit AcrA (membrane-fusion protein)
MTNELDNKPEDQGPPPIDDPNIKSKPHHLEARLSTLEPEMRSLFEKTIADKVNAERLYRQADEQLRKTEVKLNEIHTKEQAAEEARLKEQGEFKALAERHEARVRELESTLVQKEIKANLDRELLSAGVVDADLVATALSAKYGEELKADPSQAASLVARVKAEKPLLFKSEVAPAPNPSGEPPKPQPNPTGQPGTQPPTGTQPAPFNANDKKVPIAEVERQYEEMMKRATW